MRIFTRNTDLHYDILHNYPTTFSTLLFIFIYLYLFLLLVSYLSQYYTYTLGAVIIIISSMN